MSDSVWTLTMKSRVMFIWELDVRTSSSGVHGVSSEGKK